jgi:hypothetical protein
MMSTRKRAATSNIQQKSKQCKKSLYHEKCNNSKQPDNIHSGAIFINNNLKESDKENNITTTDAMVKTVAREETLEDNFDSDIFVKENVPALKIEDECATSPAKSTVSFTLLKRRSKYPNLLPGEVGNLTRFVRKELFFRLKFVTNNMFLKFKIADLCFEQINITDSEQKRIKEQSIVKVVKDALNSRRGYASQLLSEKLRGKWITFNSLGYLMLFLQILFQ